MPASPLKTLCRPETKVRETYYGETYRGRVAIAGESAVRDITCIRIPFDRERERKLQERYGIPGGELPDFYNAFDAALNRAVLQARSACRDTDDKIRAWFSEPLYFNKNVADDGSIEYYIVEPEQTAFRSTRACTGNRIMLSDLLRLGRTLAEAVHDLAPAGLTVGAFDLDTILASGIDEPDNIRLGLPLYGAIQGEPAAPVMKSTPETLHPSVRSGGSQTGLTDIYAICVMLWSVLSGKHWTCRCDTSYAPRYAPEPLILTLRAGLYAEGDDPVTSLHDGLQRIEGMLRNGELQDAAIPLAKAPSIGIPRDIDTRHGIHNETAASEGKDRQHVLIVLDEDHVDLPDMTGFKADAEADLSAPVPEADGVTQEPEETPARRRPRRTGKACLILAFILLAAAFLFAVCYFLIPLIRENVRVNIDVDVQEGFLEDFLSLFSRTK